MNKLLFVLTSCLMISGRCGASHQRRVQLHQPSEITVLSYIDSKLIRIIEDKNATAKMFLSCLRMGANLDAKSPLRKTIPAWALAVILNRSDLVQVILKIGVFRKSHADTYRDPRGWTMLMLAAFNCHLDLIKILVDAGGQVNFQDPSGITPLMLVCGMGCTNQERVECVNYLLTKEADVNKEDQQGRTALFCALAWNRKAIVDILLQAGAKANISGVTPLMFMCSLNCTDKVCVEWVNYFLEKEGVEVDVNTEDHRGRTALYWAIASHRDAVVGILLRAGAKVTEAIRKCAKDKPEILQLIAAHEGQ